MRPRSNCGKRNSVFIILYCKLRHHSISESRDRGPNHPPRLTSSDTQCTMIVIQSSELRRGGNVTRELADVTGQLKVKGHQHGLYTCACVGFQAALKFLSEHALQCFGHHIATITEKIESVLCTSHRERRVRYCSIMSTWYSR